MNKFPSKRTLAAQISLGFFVSIVGLGSILFAVFMLLIFFELIQTTNQKSITYQNATFLDFILLTLFSTFLLFFGFWLIKFGRKLKIKLNQQMQPVLQSLRPYSPKDTFLFAIFVFGVFFAIIQLIGQIQMAFDHTKRWTREEDQPTTEHTLNFSPQTSELMQE